MKKITLVVLATLLLIVTGCASTLEETNTEVEIESINEATTTIIECGVILDEETFSSVRECFNSHFETCTPAVMSVGDVEGTPAYNWEIIGVEEGKCKLKNWHSASEESSIFYDFIGEEMHCYFEDYATETMQPSADKCEGPLAEAYGY